MVWGSVELAFERIGVKMVVEEYFVSLGLDIGLERFRDKADESKLRLALQGFLAGRKDYLELCQIADEIDFQGLYDYMTGDLMGADMERMFAPGKKERGKARESIISAAVSYANADTVEAERRVKRCVSVAIDIIHEFYAKRIDRKEWLLASEIVDAVSEEVRESTQMTANYIEGAKKVPVTVTKVLQ